MKRLSQKTLPMVEVMRHCRTDNPHETNRWYWVWHRETHILHILTEKDVWRVQGVGTGNGRAMAQTVSLLLTDGWTHYSTSTGIMGATMSILWLCDRWNTRLNTHSSKYHIDLILNCAMAMALIQLSFKSTSTKGNTYAAHSCWHIGVVNVGFDPAIFHGPNREELIEQRVKP